MKTRFHSLTYLCLVAPLVGCGPESDYDDFVSRFSPSVTKQVMFTARFPVGNQTFKVPMGFHGNEVTRMEDVRHIILASQRLLEPLSRAERRTCIKNLGRVDVYHVPCAALNWDELQAELDENYVRENTKVIVGLTAGQMNRAGREDFVVGYCFDEMVRRSETVSYEEDKHFREVSLAHEMAHVWFTACEPVDVWLYPNRFEEKAWEFHTEYEATARALHVDY